MDFGGTGVGELYSGQLNDQWYFDPAQGTWTWVKGSKNTNEAGIYGVQGEASLSNCPGAKIGSIGWIDSKGQFWMFGGRWNLFIGSRYLNDLWRFDPVSVTWTWMDGSNSTHAIGVYSINGQASANNKPGARQSAIKWTDSRGRLWMFGGYGVGTVEGTYYLDDLWQFDPIGGTWTWVTGSDSLLNTNGVYGVKGQASPDNNPGARNSSTSWTDSRGRLWMFGGGGYSINGFGFLNDLWRFDIQDRTWTWVSGTNVNYSQGIYGTPGVASVNNTPGSRYGATSWTDSQGRLWLFGGIGRSSNGDGFFNDLWRFDPDKGTWTWVSGSNRINASSTYGIKGQPSISNSPGGRSESISWIDRDGSFWMFGGSGTAGVFNDLWHFDPEKMTWTWVSGSNTAFSQGVYGTQRQASINNFPGAREKALGWTDTQGRLWLFGGFGSGNNYGYLNDLWLYDPAFGTWTWVSGSSTPNEFGQYEVQGEVSAKNGPGARFESLSWTDNLGRLWMFGGYGYYGAGATDYLNDLWRFDPKLTSSASIAIATPDNNSNFVAGSTISSKAWAINPSGTIHFVDFFEHDNKVETDSSKPYTLTRSNVPVGTYRISAIAITDLGETLRSDTITINVKDTCAAEGKIYGEGYTNIQGSAVTDLTSHPSYPNNPTLTGQLSAFEYRNIGDNYGGRFRGYLCVPQTGAYTFYLAADDQAGFWLSSDENSSKKQLIAYTTTYTDFRQWNKFNTQQSQPVYLIAGARYYVETLHKEAVGQDHLSVAWKLPDGKFEGPIPGSHLSPFTESGATNPSRAAMNFEKSMRLELNEKLQVKAIPNPSNSHYTINVDGITGTPIQMTVTDVLGRSVEHRTNLQANTILQLGHQWKPGIYILQLQQGKDYKTIKLIKE